MPWIRSCWSDPTAQLLEPMGWFQAGHNIEGWTACSLDGFERPMLCNNGTTFIWAPPPFAAEVARAEMRKTRVKCQRLWHLFVCPSLCTPLWQKQLFKCADFVFEFPVGSTDWPQGMHEPLVIGVLFSLSSALTHGNYGAPPKCTLWVGNCVSCLRLRNLTQGIFCANLGAASCWGSSICRNVWCSSGLLVFFEWNY